MSLFRALTLKHRSTAIYIRTLSSSSSPQSHLKKKSLHHLFREAVGPSPKTGTNPEESETQSHEIKMKLWELEEEIRQLREADDSKVTEPKKMKSLYGLFTGADVQQIERSKQEGPMIFKELSADMKMFVTHLYSEGYFKDANFIGRGHLDFCCFNDSYGRDFIKFAAEKFGKEHQQIAKWLSGSDLKKVALFGCPSLSRKDVFSAKRLRQYFQIPEDDVCNKCVLKHSCKFVNRSVWGASDKNLDLAAVMRIITLYALEPTHPELSVPDDIKASVMRLLNETLKLSQTTS
ncbi:uncharacterized protein LOC126666917 [Mercurialis annua]|uniref:uncharacterized protein LOC126666917 n=1 Tax=Mercurialis annua TaxID=3986 RepID=UPI00215E96BB|nr:uncharacterized protein LOC126666917 [Mercurialis annua]